MAKRFRFRLEAVRRVREMARDTQRRVVAAHVRTVTRVESRIHDLVRLFSDAGEELADVRRFGVLDIRGIRQYQAHRDTLHRSIHETQKELAREREELLKEQETLAEASKQLKAMEKLRDKQRSRHNLEVSREEQVTGDEAATQMYLRKKIDARNELST